MDAQRVIFNRTISGHTLEMAKLFYIFSNMDYVDELSSQYEIDCGLSKMVDLIEIGANRRFDKINYSNNNDYKRVFTSDFNNIIVCFSGGKDSTSAALKMKEQGYNVYLYYVFGINKSYPDEFVRVKELAKMLDMPLFVEKVVLKGHTTFHDNPVKNQLIASMALDYGIKNKISAKVCFGDFTDDNVLNSSFLEAWSDTQEMWYAHQDFVMNYVPFYEIKIPFKNYRDTLDVISSNERLLSMVQGCVLPYRFRNKTKEINEQKYNVKLLPNRCGSCWKCCVEYIFLADKGVVEYNEQFYKHCLDILSDKMSILHANVAPKDMKTTYETFLMQGFEKSKIWKQTN